MELTKRQSEVADRLLQGMTIAAIAQDLALTESRVNQIIRALKNRFDVSTQAGVVAAYQRAMEANEIVAAEIDAAESAIGNQSLVPDILNSPHPILYRLVAICLAALLIALTLLVLSLFALTFTEASKPSVDVATGARDGIDG